VTIWPRTYKKAYMYFLFVINLITRSKKICRIGRSLKMCGATRWCSIMRWASWSRSHLTRVRKKRSRGLLPSHQDCRGLLPSHQDCRGLLPSHQDCRGLLPSHQDCRGLLPSHQDCRGLLPSHQDCWCYRIKAVKSPRPKENKFIAPTIFQRPYILFENVVFIRNVISWNFTTMHFHKMSLMKDSYFLVLKRLDDFPTSLAILTLRLYVSYCFYKLYRTWLLMIEDKNVKVKTTNLINKNYKSRILWTRI